MAAKKIASKAKKTKTPKKNVRGAAKKPAKPRFYATPNRLFAAAATSGGLPKGSYALIDSNTPGGIDTQVRIGTKGVCVFEGTLRDLVTAALGKQRIKVRVDGELIPSPAGAAPAATPSS